MGFPDSELAQRIFKSHQNSEYTSVLVHGDRGVGKSTFAMWTIYDLFHNGYETPSYKAWQIAYENTIHGIESVVKRGKNALEKGTPDPAWHIDDAGKFLHGDNYNIPEKRPWMIEYKSLSPTMRKCASGVIYSLDRIKDLVGFVQDRPHNLILIKKHDKKIKETGDRFWRVAYGYEKDTWPDGKETISGDYKWHTEFNCKLPDKIFEKYDEMRDKYTLDALESLENAMKKSEGKDEDDDWDPWLVAEFKLKADKLDKSISYGDFEEMSGIPKSTLHNKVQQLKEKTSSKA